jgi:splicing suppressor protein 51
LRVTSIWVSFVLREMVARLIARVQAYITADMYFRKVTTPLMACIRQRSTAHFYAALRPYPFCVAPCPSSRRYFFSFLRKPPPKRQDPIPTLAADNLFHPFSKSPFPMLRARGEAIKKLAPCPVCTSSPQGHTHALPRNVQFECPDCGWPTHCSEEHWKEDEEHQKYCLRLREANEDEHDLRSGRRMFEFELPGE